MSRQKQLKLRGTNEGLGALGAVLVVLLVTSIFVVAVSVGAAITAAFVALVWNGLNVHELVGAPRATVPQLIGIALVINLTWAAVKQLRKGDDR